MRLLTYNILKGGEGREAQIVEVIRAAGADVVVVPEVRGVEHFRRIAAALGMAPRLAEGRRGRIPPRVGLLSRLPVLGFRTLRPWPVWPGCIEATVRPADGLSRRRSTGRTWPHTTRGFWSGGAPARRAPCSGTYGMQLLEGTCSPATSTPWRRGTGPRWRARRCG